MTRLPRPHPEDRRSPYVRLSERRAGEHGYSDEGLDPWAPQHKGYNRSGSPEKSAVIGGGSDGITEVKGKRVPKGGCLAEVVRRLSPGPPQADLPAVVPVEKRAKPFDLAGMVRTDADRAAESDPELRAAEESWARCMKDRGFDGFSDPHGPLEEYNGEDAVHDHGDGNNPGPRPYPGEAATARADRACNEANDLEETWVRVLSRHQRLLIAENESRLVAADRWWGAYARNARRVLRS